MNLYNNNQVILILLLFLYDQVIRSMSQLMPVNENDMLKIDGVTKANFEKFGQPLLEITQQAAAEKSGI